MELKWLVAVQALANSEVELFVPTSKGGSLVFGNAIECTDTLPQIVQSFEADSHVLFPVVHLEAVKE
jgi:hypothetical protein